MSNTKELHLGTLEGEVFLLKTAFFYRDGFTDLINEKIAPQLFSPANRHLERHQRIEYLKAIRDDKLHEVPDHFIFYLIVQHFLSDPNNVSLVHPMYYRGSRACLSDMDKFPYMDKLIDSERFHLIIDECFKLA